MSDLDDLLQNDDLERAVELLIAKTRARQTDGALDSSYVNRAINFAGQLAALRRERADGLVSREDAQIERNRIRLGVRALHEDVVRVARITPALPPDASPLPELSLAPPESTVQEAIFGARQLRSVGWLRRGLDLARAVCRISTPAQYGTGFHIGGGRILTCRHVLPSMSDADAAIVLFDYEEVDGARVKPGHRFRTRPGTWRGGAALDCAVVTLEGEGIEGAWGALSLELGELPRKSDHVTIIQHPEGGPKQIAMTANEVRDVSGACLLYTTDTLAGSSGAPVFNDAWRVVAVHRGARKGSRNALGESFFANEGILARSVAEALGLATG